MIPHHTPVFGMLDHGSGSQQVEGEAYRVAVDARQPADAHFQSDHAPLLPCAIEFLFHLVDQGLDDGKFVHGNDE